MTQFGRKALQLSSEEVGPGRWGRWRACLLGLVVPLAVQAVFPASAGAQTFPVKPVRLVIPYAPGGGAETQTRLMAGKLSEFWGQPVLVENRPGGAFAISAGIVARSAPDGYTILSTYSSMLTAAASLKEYPLDIMKTLTLVSWLTEVPSILAVPASSEARSIKDLLEIARKSPRQLTFGSTGLGGTQHLNAEMVMLAAQAKGVHVPYKGTSEAATALLGEQVDFAFVDNTIRPHIKSGKVRPLAVSSSGRWDSLPDIPTMRETLGVNGAATRNYYLVPAATPTALVNQINAAIVKGLRSPDLAAKVSANGYNIIASSPEEGARAYQAEFDTYSKLVKQIGLVIE